MKHDVDDSLIYLTADILIQIIQIRWMWVTRNVDVIEKLQLRLRNKRNVNTETLSDSSHFVFRCSPHLKSYPYTSSPRVLSISIVLVHYSNEHSLSQYVVICVDKSADVSTFASFVCVWLCIQFWLKCHECKWRRGDNIYVNRLNRCVHSCVPFSLRN